MTLVSVVVPTYYRNERLREALASVGEQTHSPIETIVVDGSGDAHASPVVESFECTYIPQRCDRGTQAARSAGMDVVSGQYVQFLDDDDRLHPTKLEKQLAVFGRTEDVGVVYCGRRMESGTVERPRVELSGDVLERSLAFDGVPCIASTMLLDVTALEPIHPFENRHAADDLGMRIELARRTNFEYVDEVLLTAGEPEDAQGRTWRAIEGKKRLLEQYADLYDEYPPRVRREALADIYQKTGRRHLEDCLWSPSAIWAFSRAIWYAPEIEPIHVGELLTALAGRPGRHIATRLLE